MFGFYKRRLRATMDWGNTYSSRNYSYPCGCSTDHIFLPRRGDGDYRSRTVVVRPCLKHTGKFFRTRWR